jgi:hypothetical protein
MSTRLDTHDSRVRTALSVGSVLAALGALSFIAVIIFSPDLTDREAYKSPGSVVAGIAATFGLVIMMFSLLRWRTPLPNWAILTAAAGMFFAAANAWYVGTVAVAVADATTDTPFEDIGDSSWYLAGSAPKMLLCLVGFVALGIIGWRQRSIPRAAAGLLVLAGLASVVIPPFPPGVLLASIAFYLIAGSAAPKTVSAQA